MTAVEPRTDSPRQPGGEPRAERAGAGPRVRGRVFRPRRMVPATITAAVIFVGAALAAAAIIAGLLGRRIAILHVDTIGAWPARTPWSSPIALAVGAVLAVLGLVLIVTALVPGRPRVVALSTGRPDVLMGITRRGLRCVAATAAADVDGVERIRATARGRRVRVKVTTPLRDRIDAADVGDRVRTAVTEALTQLDLTHPPKLRVRVRRTG